MEQHPEVDNSALAEHVHSDDYVYDTDLEPASPDTGSSLGPDRRRRRSPAVHCDVGPAVGTGE
jgi:hypothetical protein